MDNQKVILITGCSSGFGLLTAVRLAAAGHFVWATMRDLSGKKALEDALNDRQAQATIRCLDVTKPSTITDVVSDIEKTHGSIDVLINNAGYAVAGFFEDLSEEEIRSQMETNFFGVQAMCRAVIPLMRKHKFGKIINISSIAGLIATPSIGAYNASKWALEAFSESLYHELGLFGIQVALVEPGSYPTKIFSKKNHYAQNIDNPQSPYYVYSQRLQAIVQDNYKKLKNNPDDVAKLIEHIINNPRPRLRYISDFSSWMRVAAQKHLPPSFVSMVFRRFVHANN